MMTSHAALAAARRAHDRAVGRAVAGQPGWAQAPTPSDVAGAINVRAYGAKGDGSNDDASHFAAAHADALARGVSVHLPPGQYRISGTVTATAPMSFEHGARVVASLVETPTIVLQEGYEAGPHHVFGDGVNVEIWYSKTTVIYPEHFGAQILSDPRVQTAGYVPPDSTEAFNRIFLSLVGRYYPTSPAPYVTIPGMYTQAEIVLLGFYGISDEVKTNGGSGFTMRGTGVGLVGCGFRWIGAESPSNATKAMLRMYGAQFASMEAVQFLAPTPSDPANRLFAAVDIYSQPTDIPAPYTGEQARRCRFTRVLVGDNSGVFNIPGDYQFQRGITTDGSNGNDDFHVFDTCVVTHCEYGFVVENSQNVDIQFRNVATGQCKTAGIWFKHGTEALIDGWYFYNGGAGSTWMKLGPAGGDNNYRITMRMVGGEGNDLVAGFCANDDPIAQLFLDVTRAEILQLAGKPFFTGVAPNFAITFTNAQVSGNFAVGWASTAARPSLEFANCRELAGVTVQNEHAEAVLTVDIRNSWANAYTAAPNSYQNRAQWVGPLNGRHIFRLQATPIALDDDSLYGKTSLDAHSVGIGHPQWGIESRIVADAFKCTTLAKQVNTLTEFIPAGSVVAAVRVMSFAGSWTDGIFPALGGAFIGDGTTIDRYGVVSADGNFQRSTPAASMTLTHKRDAQDVVLTAHWLLGTYTQSGNTLTYSGNGILTSDMVGKVFHFHDGPLAGQSCTVTARVNGTTLTVDTSASGTGTGYFDANFTAGATFFVAPVYQQTFADGFDWPSISYVATATVT